MMISDIKRLFFGLDVIAPWPLDHPKGRLLDSSHRHLTLEFLGNISYAPLKAILADCPLPPIIGYAGYFDACLTLPLHHPNVVAWHTSWFEKTEALALFQNRLKEWLLKVGYSVNKHTWNPHVTICRQPFHKQDWMKSFRPLPFITKSFHLYESLGGLQYLPIWSVPILSPFEEIDHTADMAFIIRGHHLQEIYANAFTAIAFKVPQILDFFIENPSFEDLVDVIILLNQSITKLDSKEGCPLKAVSFHGELNVCSNALLEWEMIIDV